LAATPNKDVRSFILSNLNLISLIEFKVRSEIQDGVQTKSKEGVTLTNAVNGHETYVR